MSSNGQRMKLQRTSPKRGKLIFAAWADESHWHSASCRPTADMLKAEEARAHVQGKSETTREENAI
jgi:hypothetical protein